MEDEDKSKEGLGDYLSICRSIYKRLQSEGKLDELFATKDTDKYTK